MALNTLYDTDADADDPEEVEEVKDNENFDDNDDEEMLHSDPFLFKPSEKVFVREKGNTENEEVVEKIEEQSFGVGPRLYPGI